MGRPTKPLTNSKMWPKYGTSNGEIISLLRDGLVTWEIFKTDFLDRFFPREKREANVEEFINFFQGGMSVLDYSLKLTESQNMLLNWFPTLGMK